MAFFQRSERGIGRGEIAESQIEAPFFAGFTAISLIILAFFHITYQNSSYTIALGASLVVFALTILRVQFGLYILTVAMLLSPEIEAGSVGQHAERGLNLRYDDILIPIIFIGVLVKQAFEGRFVFWRANPVNAGILGYLAVCILSSLRALHLNVPAWDESVAFFVILKMFEFYLVFWIISHVITNAQDLQRQLVVFFVVSFIVCAYGFSAIGSPDRVSAPFEVGGTEPNTLGGYLMIIICVSLGFFIYSPTMKWRIVWAFLAFTAFVPLVMTLSRATYFSLFVALLLIGIFARKPLVVMAVLLLILTAPLTMPDEVVDRVMYTFHHEGVDLAVGGIETDIKIDKSTYERVYVWEKVRFNMGVWPWLGGGVSWDTVLDSQYARVLIETGILGALAFAFLLFRLVRTSWQAFRWNRYWVFKGLSLGMLVTTLGLIVHGLGTISFLIVRIMEPYWMLMALTVVARQIALVDYQQKLKVYHTNLAKQRAAEADALTNDTGPQTGVPVAG